MRKFSPKAKALCLALGWTLASGCGSSGDPTLPIQSGGGASGPLSALYQNPFLSPNPGNNIHNDSYLSDTYEYPGPTSYSNFTVQQQDVVGFADPYTGEVVNVVLGEGSGHAFDPQGNIQTVTAGIADPNTNVALRSVVTLDRNTLSVLAWYPFEKVMTSQTDFGGAGYFYQDNQFRMVVALPDGHVKVLERQKSELSNVDKYVAVRDINITGTGGLVSLPAGLAELSLYALMPDKDGNIWFTIAEGIVGAVKPDGQVSYLDVNDPNRSGTRVPESDGDFEEIANSHSVDEGDSGGPSGVYVLSTHKQYRFGLNQAGQVEIVWEAEYDRGSGIKPGQVSQGSGTSPTVFHLDGRRFVAIADNADNTMRINVYRAEAELLPGEQRLFAQGVPFGGTTNVCDENSLIVAPAPDSSGGVDIFAENNFGYTGIPATDGAGVTEPGFARMRLLPDGSFQVQSVNSTIRVPTVVSKMSTASNTVYTYEKRTAGWYMTGLDATDLNSVKFAVPVGPGTAQYNNHYAALSLDPDGRSIWIGTVFGVTKVRLQP